MPEITFRADLHGALFGLDQLGRAGHVGIARALRRTAVSAQTELVRDVTQDTGLRQGDVKKAVTVTVDTTNQIARVVALGAPLPLSAFNVRGPFPSRGRGQVTYDVGQGRKTLPGGFIAEMSSGHRGVFVRVGAARKSRGAWSKNLGIAERFGPSIAHVFAKFLPAAAARAEEQMGTNLEHEFQYALSQGG